MALTPVLLGSGVDTGAGATLTTPTLTPQRGLTTSSVYMLFMHYVRGSYDAALPPSNPTGMGLTWTRDYVWGGPSTSEEYASGYVGMSGAWSYYTYTYIATGIATEDELFWTHYWTMSGSEVCLWAVVELPITLDADVDTYDAMRYSDYYGAPPDGWLAHGASARAVSASASSLSLPMKWNTVAAANDGMIAVVNYGTGATTVTPPSGWTSLVKQTSSSTNTGMEVFYRDEGNTAETLTFTLGAARVFQARAWELHDVQTGVREILWTDGVYTNATTAITPVWPAGYTPLEGDVALMVLHGRAYGTSPEPTFSGFGATGWTKDLDAHAGSGDFRLMVYSKRLAAGDSPTSVAAPTAWQNYTNGAMGVRVGIFRGVDPNNIYDVAWSAAQYQSTATWPTGGLTSHTVARAGSLGVMALAPRGDVYTLNASSAHRGWTYRAGDGSLIRSGYYSSYIATKKYRAACTPDMPLFSYSSAAGSYVSGAVLKPAIRLMIEPDIVVGSLLVDATLDAQPGSLYLTPEVIVEDVQMSTILTSRPLTYRKPKRPLVWVYDYSGERVNVLD